MMGHHEHRKKAPARVNVALVTVSTSRSFAEDRSGPVMAGLVEQAGHRVHCRKLVKDGIEFIQGCLAELGDDSSIQAVFLSGGTGVSSQDLTVEAIEPLVVSWLPGFGETFRRLSFEEIGTAGMLSRACAAVCCLHPKGRRMLVAVLPGSPHAVRLALGKLLLPELGHIMYEVER
jgi:molybdenum cofactor biosynthesis protein B